MILCVGMSSISFSSCCRPSAGWKIGDYHSFLLYIVCLSSCRLSNEFGKLDRKEEDLPKTPNRIPFFFFFFLAADVGRIP